MPLLTKGLTQGQIAQRQNWSQPQVYFSSSVTLLGSSYRGFSEAVTIENMLTPRDT